LSSVNKTDEKKKNYNRQKCIIIFVLIQFTSVLFYNDRMCIGKPTKLTHGYLMFYPEYPWKPNALSMGTP